MRQLEKDWTEVTVLLRPFNFQPEVTQRLSEYKLNFVLKKLAHISVDCVFMLILVAIYAFVSS